MTDRQRVQARQEGALPARVVRPKKKPIPKWTGGFSK